MANLLLLTLVFSPDGVSTSALLTELAHELKVLGHDITVFTTTPHYNVECDARAQQPLRPRLGRILYQSDCNGIPVYHASIPNKGNRIKARLLDYTRFHVISTIAGIAHSKPYDVILAPSPPLTIGISAWILGRSRCAPFIYNVQEIYPDIAVSLGMMRNEFLIRAMKSIELIIYKRARFVVVISEWFRRRLLLKGVPDDKLRVISNFVDTDCMKPGDRQNEFAKRHELEDKFIVLYAGNIGLTQNLENILSAA